VTVTVRPFLPADRFVLNRWLGEPDVIAWFGSRGAADAEIALAQSSPSSLIRIILFEGAPIGYAQAFDIGLSGFEHVAIPSGSYDADVFIGSTAHRGLGYGATALRLLTDEVFASTFTVSVAITVPLRNEAAVRRIERAGFTWQAVVHDALLGPLWILRRDRA
jgi:RimJ/RimL family protein N-acetyltransferase